MTIFVVAGTRAQGTINSAVRPDRSQSSPISRVFWIREAHRTPNAETFAVSLAVESGNSISRYLSVTGRSSKSISARAITSRRAVAGFGAQYTMRRPRVCQRPEARRPPPPSSVRWLLIRQTVTQRCRRRSDKASLQPVGRQPLSQAIQWVSVPEIGASVCASSATPSLARRRSAPQAK